MDVASSILGLYNSWVYKCNSDLALIISPHFLGNTSSRLRSTVGSPQASRSVNLYGDLGIPKVLTSEHAMKRFQKFWHY